MVASTQGNSYPPTDGDETEHLSPIEKAAQEDILDDRVKATASPDAAGENDMSARLAKAEAEAEKLKNEYLRALAEIENTRRRAARDREDANRYAIARFAGDMLSVADNMRRALDSIDQGVRAENPALEPLINGVEMTEKELLSVFDRHGVTKIEAEGAAFDPHVHEAMFEIPNADVPNGTIVHVLREGYQLFDRILRPAQVGVSKGGPKAAAAEGSPSPAGESHARGESDMGEHAAEPGANPEASPGAEAGAHPGASARPSTDAYEKSTDQAGRTTGINIDRST